MILEDFDMNSADRQMDFSNPSLIAEIQKRYYCVYKQQISHYTKSSLIYDVGRREKKKKDMDVNNTNSDTSEKDRAVLKRHSIIATKLVLNK